MSKSLERMNKAEAFRYVADRISHGGELEEDKIDLARTVLDDVYRGLNSIVDFKGTYFFGKDLVDIYCVLAGKKRYEKLEDEEVLDLFMKVNIARGQLSSLVENTERMPRRHTELSEICKTLRNFYTDNHHVLECAETLEE